MPSSPEERPPSTMLDIVLVKVHVEELVVVATRPGKRIDALLIYRAFSYAYNQLAWQSLKGHLRSVPR